MEVQSPLVVNIKRGKPELIAPAKPTPYEFKILSDIDDQMGLRSQIKGFQIYKNSVEMQGRDPVKTIRDALAKTLVYYYPFAGRLKETANGKLIVECSGEGVLFVEADANVRLEEFGVLKPPFPGADDLLYNVPGSADILHCPLLLIQVTRLICGGFIFGTRSNHVMSDGPGFVQFMTALGEIARGANAPSVPPVWHRELLLAREPPQVSCVHHSYLQLYDDDVGSSIDNAAELYNHCFFFGRQEMACLKTHMPPHIQKFSNFDILTACIWRCRTTALNLNFNDEVRVIIPVDARRKFDPPLPVGYYGNATGLPAAYTTVGELCQKPLGYAVGLVKQAKATVTDEFMRSTADFLVEKGRPWYNTVRTILVSDLTRIQFTDVDFGWGKALYGGPIRGIPTSIFFVLLRNNKGEDGIGVMINLSKPVMARFALEIQKMIDPSRIESSSS